MGFDQNEYVRDYNRKNYKSYQIRIRKEEAELIAYLDSMKNRNGFMVESLRARMYQNAECTYTLKQIRERIVPVLHRYDISDIYLFGSYARGEASCNSDIDIYCDKGSIRSLLDVQQLYEDLETALGKKVDVVFTSSNASEYFLNEIKKDLIKLC